MDADNGEVRATAVIVEEAAADSLVLPVVTPTSGDEGLGVMGRPFDRRTPFFIGLTGGLGVAVAYVIARGIGDITSVLIIIGLALFIAIGLNPIVAFLVRRGLSRGSRCWQLPSALSWPSPVLSLSLYRPSRTR